MRVGRTADSASSLQSSLAVLSSESTRTCGQGAGGAQGCGRREEEGGTGDEGDQGEEAGGGECGVSAWVSVRGRGALVAASTRGCSAWIVM